MEREHTPLTTTREKPLQQKTQQNQKQTKKQNPRLPSFHQINSQSPFQVL